jgi:hypothetical protein
LALAAKFSSSVVALLLLELPLPCKYPPGVGLSVSCKYLKAGCPPWLH